MNVKTVRIEIPVEAADHTGPGLSKAAKNLKKLDGAAQKVQAGMGQAERAVSKFDKVQQKTRRGLEQWMRQKYQLLLEAENLAEPVLEKLETKVRTFTGKTWYVTIKALDLASGPFRDMMKNLKEAFALLQGGADGGELSFWEPQKQDVTGFPTADEGKNADISGIDISGLSKEAENIGSALAEGFNHSLAVNALQTTLLNTSIDRVPQEAKNQAGGQEAEEFPWMSALETAKDAATILDAGKTIFDVAKRFFGSKAAKPAGKEKTAVVSGLGKRMLGSANAGTGILGFGSNLAVTTGAGNLAGGKSLSTGALSAVGLGEAAGTIAAGAALVSGGMDLYKGFTSEDDRESAVYKESGGWKIGGVGTGAAAGAAIGSIIPGLGTLAGGLIGAGIGGIAGWIQGDSVKKDYEEELRKEQEKKAAEAIKLEQDKYGSQTMKDAVQARAKNEITEEEFNLKLQNAAAAELQERFGKIELTMEEIEGLAKKIVFDGKEQEVANFAGAAVTAEKSFSGLQDSMETIDKMEWKMNLGIDIDKSDMDAYKGELDTMVESALSCLEDSHYEAVAAVNLLFSGEDSPGITNDIDQMYADYQQQINNLNQELTAKLKVVFDDTDFSDTEKAEVKEIQDKIRNITEKVQNAEMDAGFEALKIKFSGSDYSSFTKFQDELMQQTEALKSNYNEALKVSVANLKLEQENGLPQEVYDAQLGELKKGYHGQMDGLKVRVEDVQLEVIADKFGSALDNILPNVTGTAAEKLKSGMHNALEHGIDVTSWDTETASKWLGMDGVEEVTKKEIADMISQVAKTLPKDELSMIGKLMSEEIKKGMDFNDRTAGVSRELYGALNGTNTNETTEDSALTAGAGNLLANALDGKYASQIGIGAAGAISSGIQAIDMIEVDHAVKTMKENVEGMLISAFLPGFQISTGVEVTLHPELKMGKLPALPSDNETNVTAPDLSNLLTPENGRKTEKVPRGSSRRAQFRANGDIVNSPILSWVGEDGPEAVIPLGGKRRSRGLSLWEKAGELLGVRRYAAESVSGSDSYSRSMDAWERSMEPYTGGIDGISQEMPQASGQQDWEAAPVAAGSGEAFTQEQRQTEIRVEVNVSPSFDVTGENQEPDSIIRIIRAHMHEIADDLGGEIAKKLQAVYSNMPLKGV